jgi:hypothetical protein
MSGLSYAVSDSLPGPTPYISPTRQIINQGMATASSERCCGFFDRADERFFHKKISNSPGKQQYLRIETLTNLKSLFLGAVRRLRYQLGGL